LNEKAEQVKPQMKSNDILIYQH